MDMSNLLMILLIGLLSRTQMVKSDEGVHEDEITLMAIREELGLSLWSGSSYCSWSGIVCNSNNSAVEKIDLSHKVLQGNISLFSNLKSLKWLDLSYNYFHGSIPLNLGNLYDLEFLDLSYNKFGGSIPPELGKLQNLRSLNLSNNFLSGAIPDELEGLIKIHDFQIYTNTLTGNIPNWVGNLTNLRFFTAYENELEGKIPDNLGLFSELQGLNLHSNTLQGSIPDSIFQNGKLRFLVLTQNNLSGFIPELIGNCKGLSSIRIGNNRLIGGIPKSVGNVSSLTYFEADNNHLSGEIASEFSLCSNLTLLNLADNGFSGTIPEEFGQLTNLQELIVSGNSLFGEIPTSILRSKNLNKLDLTNNKFNGTIPESVCNSSRLQYLLLGQNSIRGEIPHQIGNCMKLLQLELGSNYLTGTIPPEIGHIKNLQIALNLSSNHLQGHLPTDLGRLDKLVSLDVANNQLTGSLPSELRGMMSLIIVNFSNNHLTGQIPAFAPFLKSPRSSFSANEGLCGEPLDSLCEDTDGSDQETAHHKVSYRIVLAVIGSGLSVFASVTVVVVLFMMREKQEKEANSKDSGGAEEDGPDNKPVIIAGNVFVENLRQAIDFDAVVKSALKDSNKLSVGTFSTVYKAQMPSGLTLSVKRLKSVDRTIVHYQTKMVREMERLSRLCHDNISRPVGFVIYDDVALLLHRYLVNGTLTRFLHDDEVAAYDWPRRLSIAVGVAEGLTFLHHVAIIHLDISSGNILLDSDFKPFVSEVEISKLLDPSRGTASISAVAGSFGYIPPEYAYTMQVTAPGNVYSYGVILLEILTTRLPVDEEFGEGIDLVKWVQTAPARGETPEQILDSKLSTVSFAWRKQMLAALKVALLCTDTTPAKRPKMKQVVEMMKEITEN